MNGTRKINDNILQLTNKLIISEIRLVEEHKLFLYTFLQKEEKACEYEFLKSDFKLNILF